MLIYSWCLINWVFLSLFCHLSHVFLSLTSVHLPFHAHPSLSSPSAIDHLSTFSNLILFLLLLPSLLHHLCNSASFPLCPPETSPPPSAPRPIPRPGGRAPPDPLPSVSAAPQQIGGMVWDFLGKWVLCPGTSVSDCYIWFHPRASVCLLSEVLSYLCFRVTRHVCLFFVCIALLAHMIQLFACVSVACVCSGKWDLRGYRSDSVREFMLHVYFFKAHVATSVYKPSLSALMIERGITTNHITPN